VFLTTIGLWTVSCYSTDQKLTEAMYKETDGIRKINFAVMIVPEFYVMTSRGHLLGLEREV